MAGPFFVTTNPNLHELEKYLLRLNIEKRWRDVLFLVATNFNRFRLTDFQQGEHQ